MCEECNIIYKVFLRFYIYHIFLLNLLSVVFSSIVVRYNTIEMSTTVIIRLLMLLLLLLLLHVLPLLLTLAVLIFCSILLLLLLSCC